MTAHHSHQAPHAHHGDHNGYIALIIILVLAVILGLTYVRYAPDNVMQPTSAQSDSRGTFVADAQPTTTVSYAATVTARARASQTIGLSECHATPDVTRIPMGSTITFTNPDARPHIISFGPGLTMTVPGSGTLRVTFDFWNTPGIRTFYCDSIEKAGIVYITESAR